MTIIENLTEHIAKKFSLKDCLFFCSIPLDKHVVKKNNRPIFMNQRTKQHFLGKDPSLKKAEDYMTTSMIKSRLDQGINQPIKDQVWVIFHFYFDNYYTQKNQVNKKLPDLSNLYQLPEDCLQAAGVIDNDNLIESHDLSRRLNGKENKLEIFVLRYYKNS